MLKKIDGILLLNKPLHLTSNGALQRVKRLFGAKKAGHTGSLDPLATGMLPICFGEATKFSQFLLDSDKYYRAHIKLGVKTTTGDAEGDVIATHPVTEISAEKLEKTLAHFLGAIQQIPPMFSALKHQGKPLYELARQGIEIERKPRDIFIHAAQLISSEKDTFILDVHCSKGTYIRTLAEDIGDRLGFGAHLIGLHRIAVSPYQHNKMIGLSELEEMGTDLLQQCLLPIDSAIQHFPRVTLSSADCLSIRKGQTVRAPDAQIIGSVRLFSELDEFIGLGEILDDGRIAPRRLVAAVMPACF